MKNQQKKHSILKSTRHTICGIRISKLLMLVLLCLIVSNEAYAEDEYIIGLFFAPTAMDYLKEGVYTNHSHSIFMDDYTEMINTLSGLGFNAIILDAHYGVYRYEFDVRINNLNYSASRGFNSTEIKEIVRIARQRGIRAIPSLQVLSHQNTGVLSQAYPEYMLPEPDWEEGRYYRSSDYVEVDGITYRSRNYHTSSLDDRPGYGVNWSNYWYVSYRRTRNPYNQQGEQVLFGMIDELIDTFTVDGIKPETIHIASDELQNWFNWPEESNGMIDAEVFAMAITNVYNHIRQNNPEMDIIMWADMLDENWNGGKAETPVAGAVDLLPKDIILDDWRYRTTISHGYDPVNRTFPSVGKYMEKGYDVIVSPWCEPGAAEELIWTGKKEGLRIGKFKGVIYTVWLGCCVPSLSHALNDYPGWQDLIPDSYRYVTIPSLDVLMQGVADTIEQTVDIINLKECRGTDDFCGLYPNWEDTNLKDGFYGTEYRDYYCSNNTVVYRVIEPPDDYVSYWKFEGSAVDEKGINNGVISGDPQFIAGIQGQALDFDGVGDYVNCGNGQSLRIDGDLTVAFWLKPRNLGARRENPICKSYGGEFALTLEEDPDAGRLTYYHGSQSSQYWGWRALDNNTLVNGQWQFVVLTRKATSRLMRTYYNGTLERIEAYPDDIERLPTQSSNNLLIGDGYVYNFNGAIDEVRIYNRVLTDAEIKRIYEEQNRVIIRYGDVSGDGQVSAYDAALAAR
ncbi:LamG-like jellyroll fold domain-containing protein [Planctomycetota bacterium]